MSDLDIIKDALDQLWRDRLVCPSAVAFSPITESRLAANAPYLWADSLATKTATMFGHPVIIAPWLPSGEVHIRSGTETIKIVNLG